MKNKKAMSLSIVILVMLAMLLSISALAIFMIRGKNLSMRANIVDLERIYAKETLINYYIEELIRESTEGNSLIDEETFIKNFKENLKIYKKSGNYEPYELIQVEEQLNELNLDIYGNELHLILDINLEDNIDNYAKITYSYRKTFEKTL